MKSQQLLRFTVQPPFHMPNLKHITHYLWLSALASLLLWGTACDRTRNCPPQNNELRVAFFTLDQNNKEKAHKLDSMYLYIIEPQQHTVYEKATQPGSLMFPLSHSAKQMKLRFKANTQWDTLSISYTTQRLFNNIDCGFSFNYHITAMSSTQHSALSQIRITNPTIDEHKDTNIHFIFSRD